MSLFEEILKMIEHIDYSIRCSKIWLLLHSESSNLSNCVRFSTHPVHSVSANSFLSG